MRRYFFILAASFFVLFFLLSDFLLAHGVVDEVIKAKTMIIKAAYDDGEPMGYAEVKIFSPEVSKVEYQNGRTDKNGCFSFLPDQKGEWKAVVDDGIGHGFTIEIEVGEINNIKTVSKTFPHWQGVITGLGIIWGLMGLIFYFRARKKLT